MARDPVCGKEIDEAAARAQTSQTRYGAAGGGSATGDAGFSRGAVGLIFAVWSAGRGFWRGRGVMGGSIPRDGIGPFRGFGNAVSTLLRRVAGSRTLQLFLVGGLIFLFFFYWRYANIPDELYQTRDDGVITMSHARNLVEYGFIGVNPSGERVEGYSAPAQFWAYAAAYALTGVDYHTFAAAQTALCTFLLGAIFILFFRENRRWAIAITALAALLLSWHYPFLGWHGSGMENAITHVLFLAAALILFNFARRRRIVYPWAIVIFLASTIPN